MSKEKKPMFGTIKEYDAYFIGVKNGFKIGFSLSTAIFLGTITILRWLGIW